MAASKLGITQVTAAHNRLHFTPVVSLSLSQVPPAVLRTLAKKVPVKQWIRRPAAAPGKSKCVRKTVKKPTGLRSARKIKVVGGGNSAEAGFAGMKKGQARRANLLSKKQNC